MRSYSTTLLTACLHTRNNRVGNRLQLIAFDAELSQLR